MVSEVSLQRSLLPILHKQITDHNITSHSSSIHSITITLWYRIYVNGSIYYFSFAANLTTLAVTQDLQAEEPEVGQ
jgi:hypothetical protein